MTLGDREVMCTHCPKPCEACRSRGPGVAGGPYCESTPCSCTCHDSAAGAPRREIDAAATSSNSGPHYGNGGGGVNRPSKPRGPGGRPKAKAPKGRVTLERAAEFAGVSKATVYRRVVTEHVVPHQVGDDKVITIARGDVKLIKPREPGKSGRGKAVMVRSGADPARYEEWEREAGDKAVSTWLAELGDAASGYQSTHAARRSLTR
jgi:hypothetical protein